MIIDQWYEFRWTLLWCWRHLRKAPRCFAAHPNKAIFPRKLLFCCWMHLCFWRKIFHFYHNSANEGEMCPVLAEDWESHLFRHRGFHYNAQCGFFCDYNVKLWWDLAGEPTKWGGVGPLHIAKLRGGKRFTLGPIFKRISLSPILKRFALSPIFKRFALKLIFKFPSKVAHGEETPREVLQIQVFLYTFWSKNIANLWLFFLG